MKPSITDLHCLSDNTLFETVSEGVAHIVENAESLESMAVRLIELGEHRGARMFRALAAEESAKVLILVDVVRCPLEESDRRVRTLRRFYDHLAKHIHAKACSWRTADFAELERAIHRERRALYLDGPNEVDWIFPNYAKTERARPMYVDYVKDITEVDGDCQWISPLTHREYRERESHTPLSLITARALYGMGLTTPEGLFIVADEWRPFKLELQTRYFSDLSPRIDQTLLRVIQQGLCPEIGSHYQTIVDHWPFPLWSLNLAPLTVTRTYLKNVLATYIKPRSGRSRESSPYDIPSGPGPGGSTEATRRTVPRSSGACTAAAGARPASWAASGCAGAARSSPPPVRAVPRPGDRCHALSPIRFAGSPQRQRSRLSCASFVS